MDTTTSALLTGTIVVLGRWAEGKSFESKTLIGIVGAALFLSLIGQANDKLARQFGMIILLTASFTYLVPVLKKAGLIQDAKAKK